MSNPEVSTGAVPKGTAGSREYSPIAAGVRICSSLAWGHTAIVLTVAISTAWILLAGPRLFVVTYWPDDAFFYKIVARNIVDGVGSTADGIGVTNGYHPLWMWIHIALESIFSDALVPQLVLHGVLVIIALFLLFGYIAVLTNRTIALGLCLIAVSEQTFVRVLSSGMETHLAFIALLLVLQLVQRQPWDSMMLRQRLSLSAVFTFLFFARLDGALMWVSFSFLLLVGALGNSVSMDRRVKFLCQVFVVPTLFVVTYLVANQLWFGSAMPISGRIKSVPLSYLDDPSHLRDGLDRLVGLYQVDTVASIQAALGAASEPAATHAISLIIIVSTLIGMISVMRRHPADFSLRLLLTYAALHSTYYVVLQQDSFSMQWARGPEVLLMSVAFSGLLFDVLTRLSPTPHRRGLTIVALLCLMLGSISYNGIKARRLQLVRDFSVGTVDFWSAVDYIRAHVPTDGIIASPSIGFVGYFSERRVFSVDGLLNSTEYYRDYLRRNRTLDYMKVHGVRYSVNVVPVGEEPVAYLCQYYAGLDPKNVHLLGMFGKAGDKSGVRNYAVFELSF